MPWNVIVGLNVVVQSYSDLWPWVYVSLVSYTTWQGLFHHQLINKKYGRLYMMPLSSYSVENCLPLLVVGKDYPFYNFHLRFFVCISNSSSHWRTVVHMNGMCPYDIITARVGYFSFLFLSPLHECWDFFTLALNRYNLKKLTYEERKASLIERLNALNSAAGADDDEDDE